MFKQLYPLAQSSPIAMHISAEGEKLRVFIQQKTTKKGDALSITVTAPPAELDAELAATIEAEAGNGKAAASVAAQVRAQLGGVSKAAAAKPAEPASVPGAQQQPAAPKPGTVAARKQECLDDYVRLATDPKHTSKLNREYFIEKAKTGRNFERLFGNWTKFKTAADRALSKAQAADAQTATAAPKTARAEDPPLVDDKTRPLPGVEASTEAADTQQQKEPFPGAPEAATPPQPQPWRVELADGTLLFEGDRTRPLAVIDQLTHQGTTYLVVEVIEAERRVVVAPKTYVVKLAGGTVLGAEKRALQAGAEVELAGETWIVDAVVDDQDYVVRPKLWRVQLADGTEICRAESGAIVTRIEHDGAYYRVIDVEPENYRYIVAPIVVRNVIDQDGEKLGVCDEEPEIGSGFDLDGIACTALRMTDKALFVERSSETAGA